MPFSNLFTTVTTTTKQENTRIPQRYFKYKFEIRSDSTTINVRSTNSIFYFVEIPISYLKGIGNVYHSKLLTMYIFSDINEQD